MDYYFIVLKQLFKEKARIADPDAFKDKIKQLEKLERQQIELKRMNSESISDYSFLTKSQRTGFTMETFTDEGTTIKGDNTSD